MRERETRETGTPPPTPAHGELLERERELALLSDVVAGVRDGLPGLVAIEGPAGIGKTRLLAEARRLARDDGARVLTARCSQRERELAFGVVRQLFEPQLAAADAPALRGTAAAAESLDAATGASGIDDTSFAVLHSLYWVTVNLAAEAPLVLALDDLQWCDEPSLRFLGYLVRRLDDNAVTLMCTLRPRERVGDAALLGEVVGDPHARLVRPGPLSAEATRRFVGERLLGEADERFASACHAATGGNPLLLGELLKTLGAEHVRPKAEHVSAVAELGPRALSRAVLVRLARLPEAAALVARATAVLGDDVDLSLVARLAELDHDAAAAAASALVAAELFAEGERVGFMHPLVGAAVYDDVPAHERALAHERAARLLRELGAPPSAVAVHLMRAPARGQQWVCDVLGQAANAALRAGAPASAVGSLRRALAEPPPAERRGQALLELGRAELLVDGLAAIEHLGQALELVDDPATRDEVALMRARVMLFSGRAAEGVALIRRTIAAHDAGDDDVVQALRAHELIAPMFAAEERDPAPSPAEVQAIVSAPGAGVGAQMLAAITARRWAHEGGTAAECAELALAALRGGRLIAVDNVFMSVSAVLVLELADRPEAADGWERLLQDARERGSLASSASLGMWLGYALQRRGELAEAEASIARALESRGGNDSAGGYGHVAAFLSSTRRERGDLAGAWAELERSPDPGTSSDAARYWLDAQAQLLLAEERFAEALAVAQDSERRFAAMAQPLDTPARSHAAVALFGLGRHAEGIAAAEEALELAREWGAPVTVGRALRVLGTLEREAGVARLEEAVALLADAPARLEHAKALVALGSALRAARRPGDAREPLRQALDLADRLGADGLVVHARHELHAAGGRPRTKALSGPDALTPSERRVAERAAAGQSNRAIAEALFVTLKTVERHLGNAFRKLGVSSRRELAGRLGAAAE
ncbi:MAG TPA: AAA family ATPase [Conexibacter sp.]|nr:AAA family ATPase [Conexibacter sp.]